MRDSRRCGESAMWGERGQGRGARAWGSARKGGGREGGMQAGSDRELLVQQLQNPIENVNIFDPSRPPREGEVRREGGAGEGAGSDRERSEPFVQRMRAAARRRDGSGPHSRAHGPGWAGGEARGLAGRVHGLRGRCTGCRADIEGREALQPGPNWEVFRTTYPTPIRSPPSPRPWGWARPSAPKRLG